MKLERFDALGGYLCADVLPTGTIWVQVAERPVEPVAVPQVHLLEADDAVAVAHWLLRQALTLGDPRPEVLAALGALQNLADREEAQAGG